jgi:hypothetical protein
MEDDIYMEFSAHARGHIEIEQTLPAKKRKEIEQTLLHT